MDSSQKHFVGRDPCRSGPNNPKSWCVAPEPERLKGKAQGERAMIAIVPDPVQTHLAVRFDRAIDAIELAAESMQYVLDRYWLPWDLDSKTDYEPFKKAKKERDEKETEPGLLMFRWNSEPKDTQATVLYVFLVGETPTAGINGEQFAKAVCYADRLNEFGLGPDKHPCSSNPPPPKRVVHILGPTSSGSFASLAELIAASPSKKFVINTTARSSVAIKAVCPRLKQFSLFVRPVPEATHAFIQMLATDDAIDKKVSDNQVVMNQVAILSEASTTLGESLARSYDRFDTFKYPREIAYLRNAYGASTAQNPASADKTAGPRPSLSVNLTDLTNRSDEPPNFSKASALSQEATLMNFAAEMKRKHYRYVGINASNPLDVVLLIGFLRSAVPDARLFSFESDLLLEHEPDNIPFIGTLSVTTYPLLYPVGSRNSSVDIHAASSS